MPSKAELQKDLAAAQETIRSLSEGLDKIKEMIKVGEPDPDAFFDDLRTAAVGEKYNKIERYKDFREVFMGSEAGKRVLWQILAWAYIFRSTANKDNPYLTYLNEGRRDIGLKIMVVLNAEPSPEQTEVEKEEEDNG